MNETPQQYTRRILGYVAGRDPLRVQRTTPAKIARLVRGLSRRQLAQRPAPGKWSIGEILAHLAETELVGGYRMRMILSQPGVRIQAFDQNVWARVSNYRRLNPQRSLALFRALREANLRLLRSLPKSKWRAWGMHQERGKESIARVLAMFAGHDLNHLGQIARIRGSL